MPRHVHVAITRQVKAGCEDAFEAAIRQFFAGTATLEGALGAQLLKPLPGSPGNTYGILRTFASPEDRERFYQSDLFRRWEQTIQPLVESSYSRRELHGLEAFFADPGIIFHPPRWKMALVTWMGVWPTVWLISYLVAPHLPGMPGWLAMGIDTLLVVLMLTWAVMPLLTRVLKPWLIQPKKHREERKTP